MTGRRAEADEFYAELTPASASEDEALVPRQACAGMLWSKQLFYYDVTRWLDGDPGQPAPPEVRENGRNARWRNFEGFDILSMPDKWEYPWFAAWDLAFHCVTLAHVDPAFAKYQLIMVCREWFQHPNGGAAGVRVGFREHFAGIRTALDQQGLWDDADGLFHDRLVTPMGYTVPVKVRSMVGIIPVLAAGVIDGTMLHQALRLNKRFRRFLEREGVGDIEKLTETPQLRGEGAAQRLLLSVARPAQLERLFAKLFDETEFLSPHGLRALSAYHRDHPYTFDVGDYRASIDYEPAESTTSMFGGNSNWRGPIWFPVNYVVIESLERYHRFYGDDYEIEYPTGSGQRLRLDQIVADLQGRLISLFTRDADGPRPCFGGTEKMQTDPAWKDNLIFSEYFHGDNGAAIGAFHQTGWTGLIGDVILRRHGAVRALGDVLRDLAPGGKAQP